MAMRKEVCGTGTGAPAAVAVAVAVAELEAVEGLRRRWLWLRLALWLIQSASGTGRRADLGGGGCVTAYCAAVDAVDDVRGGMALGDWRNEVEAVVDGMIVEDEAGTSLW